MRKINLLAAAVLLSTLSALGVSAPASAQSIILSGCTPPSAVYPDGSTGKPFSLDQYGRTCINGSISASLAPFTPSASGARGTPMTVTTSDTTGTLPNGNAVVVSNPGATLAYCNANGVAATVADTPIAPGGGAVQFGVPGGVTTLHCISTGAGTTINMIGGTGLASMTGGGGGSGGGGGGGAITMASGSVASGSYSSGAFASGAYSSGSIGSGAMVDLGSIADAAATAGGTGTVNSKLRLMTTQLGTLNTTLGTPLQAGGTVTANFGTLNGAATAAAQGTGNASLSSIDGKTPALGQALSAASVPVVLPAAQISTLTPLSTVTANLGTIAGVATETTLSALNTKTPALGQALAAASVPVILPSATITTLTPPTTITANAGTNLNTSALATSTNITGGGAKTQIVDGGGNVVGATANALDVNIKSGGGSGGTSSAFAAAFPAVGTAVGMTQGGNMVGLSGTSGNLNVQCANCSGSGVSTADAATFTAGSSLFAGTGGFFQTTATSNPLTNGQQGMAQMTATRALFTNLRNAAGAETGVAAVPLQVSLANTAANSTAVKVDGSAVTQTVSGTITSNVGTGTRAVSIASGQVASGAIASGAIASGAIAAGAQVDLLTMRGTKNAGTAAANALLAGGVYNATPLTLTDTQQSSFQFDANGFLKISTPVGLAQGSTTSGQTGSMIMGAVTTSAPTYTTAQTAYASLDTGGSLRVNCMTGCSGGGTVTAVGAAASGASKSGNPVQMGAVFNTTQPTVTTGQMVEAQATARGAQIVATGVDAFTVVNAAGSAVIGKVGIDQTTPGTTNLVAANNTQINGVTLLAGNGATGTGSQRVTVASDSAARAVGGEGATGSTVPSGAVLSGVQSGANMVAMLQASASVAINVATATTTQLVALSGSTKVYVTSFDVIAGGTGNITFVYGTGTNCGTGQTALTGAYNLTAQAGIAKGSGMGPVLVVPAGNALCVLTSAAVQMSGSVSYTQF